MAEAKVTAVIDAKDNASGVLTKFGSNLKAVGAIAAGAFAVSLGVKAVKAAADFETAITNVSTLVSGDASKAMEQLSDGILEISTRVPKSAQELGSSAYAIFSAGITDAGEALEVLESSAKLATTGLGSTEEATTLMTLALNNFKGSGIKAEDAANLMFKTVKAGITTVSELSQSFGLVAPLAVDAGISLEELQAATAALTQVNKSASISQNSIKAALVSLGKPTETAIELFDKLGVSTFKQLIKESGGMVGAFKAMKEATDGDSQAFAKAIGSGEALSSVLALLGAQSEAFTTGLEDMKSGTDALTEGFDKQTKTFNSQVELMKNEWNILMIEAGSVIIPILLEAIKHLRTIFMQWGAAIELTKMKMVDLVVSFNEFKQKVNDNIISPIKSAIEAVQSFIDKLKQLGSSVGQGVSGAFGKVKGLLGFQSGGVVPGQIGQAQLAVVHGGERVTPPGGSGVFGGGINISITGNTISSDIDIERLAERVNEETMRALRRSQLVGSA